MLCSRLVLKLLKQRNFILSLLQSLEDTVCIYIVLDHLILVLVPGLIKGKPWWTFVCGELWVLVRPGPWILLWKRHHFCLGGDWALLNWRHRSSIRMLPLVGHLVHFQIEVSPFIENALQLRVVCLPFDKVGVLIDQSLLHGGVGGYGVGHQRVTGHQPIGLDAHCVLLLSCFEPQNLRPIQLYWPFTK